MGKWCLHASLFIFDRIIIKVAGNHDWHKSLVEFDFGLNQTTHFGVTCPWVTKISHFWNLNISEASSLSQPYFAIRLKNHSRTLLPQQTSSKPSQYYHDSLYCKDYTREKISRKAKVESISFISHQHACKISLVMRKPVLCHMQTTKVQISLRIRAVSSAPLLFAS